MPGSLITRVLILFEQLGMELPIYLHTQPWSYRAVKLYNDFGFCIAQTDTYGTAVNEYEKAMPVLKGLCEVGKDQDLRRYLIADKDMRNRKPTADSRGEVPCTGL